MALIDVTELLSDPDFVDPIQIITRTQTVNAYGETVTVESAPIQTVGSVQPASGKTLSRFPESLRVPDSKSFFIKGDIPSDGSGAYPCILVHNSRRYQVQNVFDWTNWGAGWSEGLCVSEAPSR